MPDQWMHHDEDYEPKKRRKRVKPRHVPPAAKPDSIDARLAAIDRRAVLTFQESRHR